MPLAYVVHADRPINQKPIDNLALNWPRRFCRCKKQLDQSLCLPGQTLKQGHFPQCSLSSFPIDTPLKLKKQHVLKMQ